jgi:putative flippase GtrA
MLIIYVEGLKLHYLTAAAIAFLCGAATSYALNIRWVFNKRTFRNVIAEVSIFLSIVIAGLVLNHLCIRFLTGSAGLHYTFSKVISTVIVAAVNFSTRKYILFR